MFYWLLLVICYGGMILPDKTNPIELLWNNKGFTSRYVFSFWVASDIDSDAIVTIDFPIQYTTDLGLSSCISYRITDEDPLLIPCSVSSRKLSMEVNKIKAGDHKFQIEDISNPIASGSTGVFIIRTLQGGSIIDENALYPSIGIAPTPSSLSVTLSVEGALLANYSPIYKFTINSPSYYSEKSWMRMIFPSSYTFAELLCYVEQWDKWVGVSQISANSQLIFESFEEPILPVALTFDVYGIYNPPVSGSPGDIIIEILRENTYTVLARTGTGTDLNVVACPIISAGTISKIQITGTPLMMNSPGTYTITFLPYNKIPAGGSISIKFPSGYNGLIANTCLSVTGLKPITGSDTVTCTETTDTVTFANFQEVSGQYITINVQANNPSVSGNTGFFEIYTYDSYSVTVDKNAKAGYVTISSVQYPEGFSVMMLRPKVDNPIGSYAPLDIFLQSRFYVPCVVPPNDYLYITIDCPVVIVAGSGDISCTFGKEALVASYCNFDTSGAVPQIQIQTPMTGVDCCPLSMKITTAGVPSGFTIPTSDYGQYKFIIKVYDSLSIQLEEAEYIFGTNPAEFAVNNFWYLHNTRDAWNVLKFDFTNSVDIPIDGMIEWEFQTSNHSFPRDLGWGLQSYETQEYSCTYDPSFPDAIPSSIYCEITTGTTVDPVFVRMKGFSSVVTAGTSRWIHLSNVKNAPYAGFVPYFIMRTKDAAGVKLNEMYFNLPALVDIPSPGVGSVTGSSYIIDNTGTEMKISLTMSATLAGEGYVYVVFPHGYKWDHPNAQGIPIITCAANPLQGPTSYYEVFTQPQAAGILYSQTSADSVSSPFATCFKADKQSLWIQNPTIEVYVVVNQLVRDYYSISHGAVNYGATITFDGAMQKHDAFDKNTTNLWRLKFTQTHRITDGGSIQVLLPTTYFASVNSGCYKIVNAGISCKGVNFYSTSFHRMLLLGVTDHSPAVNLPETYQLDPTSPATVFEVWFYATTGFTSGAAVVEIFSQDEDYGIDKRIDQKKITINIADNLYPYYISMDYLHTNYIEAYGSEPWNSFEEWGPIKIIVKPNQIFPETNTLYNTFVTVTFPCVNGTQYFTKNPSGLIQCRMQTLLDFEEDGYFGRMCTFIQGTPGTPCIPDQVTFYTPTELRVDPTLATQFTYYEIEISTIGVVTPLTNGFLYPSETGYYRFIVNMNKNEGANIEQAEPLLYVMEDRFTYLYTTSEHKRNNDLNIMMFNFKLSHDIPQSDDLITPGYLLLEFPFDYSGTGAGWKSDLGTGIPDGGKIDCLQDFAVHTVPAINPDTLTGEYRVECVLKYGYLDYTTIVVKNILNPNVGTNFNLYFGGILNPAMNLYDFPIRIRTVYEDLNDYVNPTWVTLDTKVNTYVETSFNIGGGSGQTTTHIQDDFSTVIDPVRFIPGVDKLKVSFNIENSGQAGTSDWIWIQVPPGFRLPDWKDTAISIKVINGTEGGYLDSTFTCVPTVWYTWPETNLFKFLNCITLTVKNYKYPPPLDLDTPNRVEFYPITMTTWPGDPITFHSWVVQDRRSSLSRTNKFPTDYLTTISSCIVDYCGTTGYGDFGATEQYNFRFTCPTDINLEGEYIIYFPLEFTNGFVDASTCVFGAFSNITTLIGATCSVFRGTEFHISGFTGPIPFNSYVDVNITVTNPPQASMSNPYIAQRFVIATYNSTSLIKGSFQVLDRTDPAGTAWLTDSANRCLNPPVVAVDTSVVFYHQSFPLPNPGIGPIEFSISSPIAIVKVDGYIVLSTYESISLAPNGEIRCSWKIGTTEYLADDCIYTVAPSSLLPTTITMYAPTSFNIPFNTLYEVYITTVFADGKTEGISFDSGLVKYGFLVEVFANGGTTVTSAEKRYLEMVGPRFPISSITVDQWTENTYSRISIDLEVSAVTIPSPSGRIVVEFPTSPTGLFEADLGLGLSNNGAVPCQGANSLTTAISCYLFLGTPASSIPAKVVISGFSAISTGSTYTVEFPKVFNPIVGGDDIQVSFVVYALDLASGWPGSFLYYREIEYVYRVKTNIPLVMDSLSAPTATATNDFTFVLNPIVDIQGDFIVIELSSAASLASTSPVCKDNSGNVLPCTYYTDSNTVIMLLDNYAVSVTVFSIVNPLPSASYLEFYLEHWTLNSLSNRLHYLATAHLPITVTHPDKTTLLANDMLEYQIDLMPTTPIPSTGSIIITFPSEYPALPESTCYNLHENSVSFMTGAYSCIVSGLTITLTNFDKMLPGIHVVIKVLAKNPSSALTTTTGIKVDTYSTVAALAADLIETNTDLVTFTISAIKAPLFYEVPRQFLKSQLAMAGEYAPVKITISGFSNLVADAGHLVITLNGFGTIAPGSELVCLWGNKRSRCSVVSNVFTVFAPDDATWSTYPVTLTLTSTNADSIDTVGIEHPSTPGQYRIEIEGDATNDLIYETTAIDYIQVLPTTFLTSFAVTPSHFTANAYNMFKIDITTTTLIPNYGYIRVYFPTEDTWGNSLYSNDLGTGLTNGEKIPCQEYPGSTGLVALTTLTCKLYHGGASITKPAFVELTNFQAIPAATSISFVIWKVKNPANTIIDAIHIEMLALTLDDSYAELDYFYSNYVMTITAPIASDPGTPASPNNLPTVTSGKIGTVLTISVPLMDNIVAIVAGTVYLLEVSSQIPLTGVSIGGCTVYQSLNLIQYNTPPAGGAASYPTLSFTTTVTQDFQWSSPIIYCYQWSNSAAKRDGNPYIGMSVLTLGTFTSIVTSFPPMFNEYLSGTVTIVPSVNIPQSGTIQITYPSDYTLLNTDCEVAGLVLITNYQCSISGSLCTIQFFEAISAGTSITVSTDLLALADTSTNVVVNSFYDSSSTLPIETGTNTPTVTTATPIWPKYLNYPVQTLITSTAVISDKAKIAFKIKPGVAITNSATSYVTVTMGTAFAGKGTNAVVYCTVGKQRVPCYESTSNKQFTIYASSTVSISTSTWQEIEIYTQSADLDNNGYIQPASAQSNTITVVATDGTTTQTEARTISVPTNVLPLLTITYLHTTVAQLNVLSISMKTLATTIGTTDKIVLEFPLKDYNNNPLFNYDLGSGKASGENFYIDNYSLTGTFTCILYHGDSTNNYPARIEITGYNSITAGTAITFDLPRVKNPQTSGYDVNVSIRVYLSVSGLITEEKTVDYIFSPFAFTPGSTCTPISPVLSSYLTSATTTFAFTCCATVDLIATDILLLEIPSNYPFPSSAAIQAGSAFATLYKSYPSANWIAVKSTTTVACQSGSALSTLTSFINPAYEILGGTLAFKAYIISTKTPIGSISTYKPTVIDIYTYTSISTAISPTAPSAISPSLGLSNLYSTENIQSVLTVTITYTGTMLATGYFTITLNVASDPYYFYVAQGLTGTFSYSLSGLVYTLTGFTSVASPVILKIPVTNPSSGGTISIAFAAYDSYGYLLGSVSGNSATTSSLSYSTIPIQSHIFRYLSYTDSTNLASFHLSLNFPFAISTSTNYITITFDNSIDTSTYTGSGTDVLKIFDGVSCSGTCVSATWTSATTLLYVLDSSGSIASGEHYFEFSGFPSLKLDPSTKGLHSLQVWFSSSATPGAGSYYYTLYWWSPSSSGISSMTGYGTGTSEKTVLQLGITPDLGMNYAFLEVFRGITTGLGYPSALGTGLTDGNYISGMAENSGVYVEDCVIRISTSALNVGIFCRTASSSSTAAHTFYLANLQNPSSVTTAYYQAYALTFSTSLTNIHSFVQGTLSIVSSTSTTKSAAPSLTTTIVQDSATYSFAGMPSSSLVSGDTILIDFTNNRPGYQISTVVASLGISSILLFTKLPALYITITSLLPSFTMNNPIYSSSNSVIKLYSYSAQTLMEVTTSSSIVFAVGSFSSLSLTTPSTPTVLKTVAVDVLFTLSHTVPLSGYITIGFPTSLYSGISCTVCKSPFSNANYKTVVSYVTSTSGSYYIATISNFAAISPGSVYVNQIRATGFAGGASSIQVTTYASGGRIIDQQIATLTVNTVATALSGIILLPRLSLMTGVKMISTSAATDLDLHFNPYTTISPTASGYLVLTFASNSDWQQVDLTSSYVCLINGYLATSCSRSTTDLSIYPSLDLTSGVFYHLKITSNNAISNGLVAPTTTGSHRVILKSYIGVPIQDSGYIDIPIYPIFSELTGKMYVQGSDNASLLTLTMKLTTTASVANSAAFVIEFPVYDLQLAQVQFNNYIGDQEIDGTSYNCELFTTGPIYIPSAGVYCIIDQGYYSSIRTRSTRITVLATSNLLSGSTYIIGLPGVKVPTTSRGSDIIIYTREIIAAVEVKKDYQLLRHIMYTHSVNTQTSLSLGFPTMSNSKLMGTGSTYTFSFQPAISIQTTDVIVFKANPNHVAISSTTTTTLPYSFMFLYVKAGWILIQPSALIPTATVTSIDFTAISNPSYISATSSDYIVTIMHWNALTANQNTGVWKYDYNFDISIPSPPYTLGVISVSSFGCFTCTGTIESSHDMMFYVLFTYDLSLPSGSVIEVALPNGANEFQSMSYNCEALSVGFANPADCVIKSNYIMLISGFGVYTQSVSVGVYVRALSPPIAITTSSGSINVYYDSASSLNIGSQTTLGFTVTGPVSSPTGSALTHFSMSSPTISSRTGSISSFLFSFTPTTTLVKATGTVTINFLFTASAGKLLCKFIDRMNNYVEYISSSCTAATTIFTILAPVNRDIVSGQIWDVEIYTYGLSSANGFTYPAAGSSLVTVTAGTEQFDYFYSVLPLAAITAKVHSYCRTVSFSNLFKITLESTVTDYSTGGRIEIGFDSNDFTTTLSLGTTDDQIMDCSSTYPTASVISCTLQEGINTAFNYRPLNTRVRIHDQSADSTQQTIFLPNIINPSTTDINVKIRIRVFTLTGSTETVVSDELIFHVLGTSPSAAGGSNSNSFLFTENDISTGFTPATFTVITDLSSVVLTSNDHVFWRFPYLLAGSGTVIDENSTGNSQLLDVYLQNSIDDLGLIVATPPSADLYTSTTQWDFSNFENPPFVPSSMPVLTADIVVNGFHVLTISFNQNLLNHTPGTVTISQFYLSGDSLNPIVGYLSGYAEMDIIFSITGTMGTNLEISIDFPTGFALDPYCEVIGTSISPIVGDWVDCISSSNSFLVTNINGYTSNSQIQVRGWIYLPNTAGPHSIGINYYYTYPSLVSYLNSYLLTFNALTAHTALTMGRFVYSSADIPVYGGETARVYFEFDVPLMLTMNLGYIGLYFQELSFTVPNTALSCEWSNGINVWQASSCIAVVDPLTTLLSINVTAPEYHPITIGTWTITIRGLQGDTYDGLTFPTGNYKVYDINTVFAIDDIALAVALSTEHVKVPMEPTATHYIFTYNTLMNSPILLEITFTISTSMLKGIPEPKGTTYILFFFPTVVNSLFCFLDDFGSGKSNNGLVNCFDLTNMPSLYIYLISGNQLISTPGIFYIQNYNTDLTTGSTFKFYLPWLKNPALADVIIDFTVEIWEEVNLFYELKAYREFKYCYASRNAVAPTNTNLITYNNLWAHQTGKVDYQFTLSSSITGTDPEEKIVWTLSESLPVWTTNMCTAFVCDPVLTEHLLIFDPSLVVLDSDTLSLYNVPNPDNPNYSQSWTIYVFKGRLIQNKLFYNSGIFLVPSPNNYASVTWRLPDENVPNPLINRHDHYLFRFRPSTSIPSDGKITIDFPSLATDPTTTYTVDTACNPLHGIFGNGMKCASTSTVQITCTGFQEYDPWMPEIQIECFGKNPANAGDTKNFEINTYDSSGNVLYSDPTVGFYTIDYAPTELAGFRMGWPERTQATACENRNYADLYIKIVSVRGIYGTGNTLRIYLPTGVGVATDPLGVLFLECTWQNRLNKTPAEFCNYVTASPQNYVDVGVTDQQGLVNLGQYTVHVYSRDATGGLYQSSFILPAFPEWESWYILATTGSKGDGAKVINEVCPVPWTSVSLIPYSYSTSKWTIMDLTFTPSRDIPVGGGVVIEFPTTNELDLIFALDLGMSMDPLVLSKPVGCIVQSGFGSPSPGVIKCTAYKSFQVYKKTPAYIYIRGHTTAISASSSHTIRLVKFQNPIQPTSPIFNEQLRVHFTIWSYCSTSNYFQTDYARFNLDTILNIFDYTGAAMLLLPTPLIYTNEILTNPITSIFTVYTLPLHTSIDLGVTIDTSWGFVMYEFDPAFTLPTTGSSYITCNGATANCAIYAESLWVVWRENTGPNSAFVMDFLDAGSNVFKSPNYEAPYYVMSAYVITDGIWAEEHSFTDMPLVNRVVPTVVITHRLSTLHRKTYDIWTISVTPAKGSSRVVRIDILFPSEFMWLDSECSYTGLGQIPTNIYPISCISDCDSEICTNHITITNFDPLTAIGTITVTIGAMNPDVALTTSLFYVYYYSSLEDTTQIIEDWSGNSLVIDDILYPYDYWVEWPVVSIYDREVDEGSYGQIWFMFRSRIELTSTHGWYQIILPDEFDIAPSAEPKCTLYHTDMPFDNYPDRWTENRTHITVSQCLYSNKVIKVIFTGDILREFYGVKSSICTYLVLTTYPSPIDSSEGYKSSLNPGCYSIQFYAMEGSDVLESATPNICVLAQPSTTMQLYSSTIDVDTNSIFRVEFTASKDIPNGYFYMDGTYPGPQSEITLQFESYQSFAYDLAGQFDSDMQVYCNGISGITPRDGESLSCVLTIGIVTLPPPALVHIPAVITVTNFQEIAQGTFVSLHFPLIRNPSTIGDTPQVTIGVFETAYTGEVTWLEYEKDFELTPVVASLSPVQTTVCIDPTTDCSVTISNILTRTNLEIYFKASVALTSGSMIVISFPPQYTDIPTSGISATIKKKPLASKTTDTYIIDGIIVVSYPEARMVALTIPGTINALEDVAITLLNFTNPSYIDTNAYISYYSINAGGQIQDSYITDDIFLIFSLQPLKFSTNPASMSSNFAQGSSVVLSLNASVGVDLAAGTYMTLKMPTSYPDISTLSPVVTCALPFACDCSLSTGTMTISNYDKILANTELIITLSPIINPTTASIIPQSPSGLSITVSDSSDRIIAYSEFPSYRIVDPSPVLRLQAKITLSFYESTVVSTYSFEINTMQGIPSGGSLVITFPAEFPNLPVSERCFTGGALGTINFCTVSGRVLTVNVNQNIDRFVMFNITFGSVVNPTVSVSTLTSAFVISTYYSGVMLDNLDTTDPTCKITINPVPSSLSIVSYQFNPQNEGEVALYTFILENPKDITDGDDISFIVQFPIEYTYHLIPANIEMYCGSTPTHQDCYIITPRSVVFKTLSAFTASQTMTFSIYSVTNPVKSTTSKFNMIMYDNINSTVIGFDRSIDFQILSLPGILNMSSVTTSSQVTHSNTDYQFRFTLDATGIKQNGGIYIDWPGNYYNLFDGLYSCEFENSTDPRLLSPDCQFLTQSGNRTAYVKLTQEITPIGQELFLNYSDVPTLQETGVSGDFIIRIFDNDLETISIRSYPNLTPYSDLTFVNIGYRIFINTTEINVYQGSYSLPIELYLEKPSYTTLVLEPVPANTSIGIEPKSLVWQYAWDGTKSFVVYASMNVSPGTYLLTWLKTEVGTTTDTREFKPLVNIYINVLAPEANIGVICEDISYIPLSGSSLPVKVWIPIPTYDLIGITLTTSTPLQDNYVFINPTYLNFSSGDSEKYFTVSVIEGAVSGFINLELSGKASGNYYLPISKVPFQTLPIDDIPPSIYSIRPVAITRTSVQISVQTSELVHIFYLITRKGTQIPTLQMLINKEGMWSDAESYYGDIWSDISKYSGEIYFSGLQDNTDYVIFIAVLDQVNRPSEKVYTLPFITLPTYLPAKFRVYVTKISSEAEILSGTAQAFALPTDMFMNIGTDPALGITRRLESVVDTSQLLYYELTLFIKKDLESEKPITYIYNADYNPEKLLKYIPYFDSTTKLSEYATEYSVAKTSFNAGYEISSDSSGTVLVTISISTDGGIFGVILGQDKKDPSSVQIKSGFNSHNRKVKSGRFCYQSVIGGEKVELNFTGLPLYQYFTVYLTAENDLPGNPELMNDEDILAIDLVIFDALDTSFKFKFDYLNSAFTIALFSGIIIV